jgi:hypothetical protein
MSASLGILSPPQNAPLQSSSPLLMRDRRAHRNFSGAAGGAVSDLPDRNGSAEP